MAQQNLFSSKKVTPAKTFSSCAQLPNAKMHVLPCKIEYDGEAPVDEYFVQETVDENIIRTSFRGRELFGSSVPLPSGYVGYIGQKTADNIELTKSFQDFTVWNREVKPSQRDPVHKWMQWPELAAAVCSLSPIFQY